MQRVGHPVTPARAHPWVVTLALALDEIQFGFDRRELGRLGARLLVVVQHCHVEPDDGPPAVKCEPRRHDGRQLYPAERMRYIAIREARFCRIFRSGKRDYRSEIDCRAKPPGRRRYRCAVAAAGSL